MINASGAVHAPAYEAAIAYRILGLSPIPVRGRDKAANLPAGHPYLTRVATDEEIEGFDWTGNIGIVTGKLSGIVVLDIDGPEGRESLRESGIRLPDKTATVKTGKGYHVYFKYPADREMKTRVRFRPGLDLKSDGGYVLAPPSTHPSGSPYEWKEDKHGGGLLSIEGFGVDRLAQMPEALIEAASEKPRSASVSPSDGLIVEGERNDSLTAIAGSLRARGIDDNKILATLLYVNETSCDPPLEEREVEGIARSICRYDKGELRKAPLVREEEEGARELSEFDLAAFVEGGIEPPEVFQPGILLSGQRHMLYCKGGVGKTWLGLFFSREAMRRGQRVMYLDGENGPRIVAERLTLLGVGAEEIRQLLIYCKLPTLTPVAFSHALDTHAPELVVFDSLAGFLAQAGLDENSNSDLTKWFSDYTTPAFKRGVTVAILDHVTKSGEGGARGAGRKRDEMDVSWKVDGEAFGRDKLGSITLLRDKERNGYLPFRHTFRVGGSKGGFIFEPKDSDTPKLSGKTLEVYEYIRKNPGTLRSQMYGGVAAKSSISDAVTLLLEQGLIADTDGKLTSVGFEESVN